MTREERIVRYTAEEIDAMLARGESKTDWARVDAMAEEELEASIDFEEEGEIDWDNLEVTLAPSSRAPLVHVDGDLLDSARKDRGTRPASIRSSEAMSKRSAKRRQRTARLPERRSHAGPPRAFSKPTPRH